MKKKLCMLLSLAFLLAALFSLSVVGVASAASTQQLSTSKSTSVSPFVNRVAHAAPLTVPAPCNTNYASPPYECVWGTNVNVRNPEPGNCTPYPSRNCPVLETLSKATVFDDCQQQGETITAAGITNNWWSLIITPDGNYVGWVSNIYVQSSGNKIDGIADCGF